MGSEVGEAPLRVNRRRLDYHPGFVDYSLKLACLGLHGQVARCIASK